MVAKKKEASGVRLKEINRKLVTVRIIGKSPLVMHKWSEKAKREMREKHGGKKTKSREARDPEAEGQEAAYRTDDGGYGILAKAIKASVIGAAHKDLGIEKTLVRKSLFCYPPGRDALVPLECDDPEIVEDYVRVGQGSADLRYRPYFYEWAAVTQWELDTDLLKTEELVGLLDRGGFGVGLCEMRPEKGGDFGRYEVDQSFPIKEEVL